uniref:PX domain containing 1 n=1 Tax=Gallus gallus TaxID=9031 RepID=A0A8V0Y482_CHICK
TPRPPPPPPLPPPPLNSAAAGGALRFALRRRRDGLGRVRGHFAGEHVRAGLLGERHPAAHHQPAGRRGGVLRDPHRVVGPQHPLPAPQLLRPGPPLQAPPRLLPRGSARALPLPFAPSPSEKYVGLHFLVKVESCEAFPRGLITIKEAHDIEARLNEVEKLLKTIINMPWKYSRSEVVLTFFERSPLDQVLKNDNVHKIQPSFQSPVKISEIMRSNGFCLANTETIVIDHSIPNGKEKHLDVDSAEHLFESVSDFTSELEDSDDPTAYVTNLTYYHLVPFETDILD